MPEGAYRVVARATVGGRPAEDQKILVVQGSQAELADPVARPKALALLASETGGVARRASDGISGLPMREPREVSVAASEDRPLWTSPFTLLLGVAALGLAWWLGRRWGRR